MGNPLPEDLARDAVNLVENAYRRGYSPHGFPSAVEAAAVHGNIHSATLRNRLRRAKELYDLEPDESLYVPPAGSDEELEPYQEQRLQDVVTDLRMQLAEAHRELAEVEDFREAAFGLAAVPAPPPSWTKLKRPAPDKPIIEMPVLFSSDFHWGECFTSDVVDGLNEYNLDIARASYEKLIDKTIEICFEHQKHVNYPGIIYLRGGDALAGEIHEELRETSSDSIHPCVKDLSHHEFRGIKRLREAFNRVHVISVPGNHGRTDKKMRNTQYVERNYEDLITWHLEMLFDSIQDKGVTFQTPRSGDAYFPVGKLRFLLCHGDRMGSRGGQGFIGPVATIARGIWKTRQQYSQVGNPVDYVLHGHYHISVLPQYGISNGSLVGINPFARSALRVPPDPPTQWLFFVHAEKGITGFRPIVVRPLMTGKPAAPAYLPWES